MRLSRQGGMKGGDPEGSEKKVWRGWGRGVGCKTPFCPLNTWVLITVKKLGGGAMGRNLVHPLSVWPSRSVLCSHILAHLISSPQCGG